MFEDIFGDAFGSNYHAEPSKASKYDAQRIIAADLLRLAAAMRRPASLVEQRKKGSK